MADLTDEYKKDCTHKSAYAAGFSFTMPDGKIYNHGVIHCPDCNFMVSVRPQQLPPVTIITR